MRRFLSQSVVLVATIALLVGVYIVSSSNTHSAFAADDPKPCLSKSFTYKKVEEACKAGGQKAAKKLMKSFVKKAKAAGDENASNCLNCHEDFKTFKRTAKAVEWLKPYAK